MFGCVVAGRLVQTNLQVLSPGKYLFELPDPSTINHIVILLTGDRPFDAGTGASIYYNTDQGVVSGAPWKFLGILTNDKPSAVFKLGGGGYAAPSSAPTPMTIQIGISIEPLGVLEQLLREASTSKAIVPMSSSTPNAAPTAISLQLVAQRIGESMFNYLMSFARSAINIAQVEPNIEVVPIDKLQEWYGNLLKKASNDPEGFRRQYIPNS